MSRSASRSDRGGSNANSIPTAPSSSPDADAVNVTHRDWVQLGTVSTLERAVVDPRGLVSPGPVGWSLDWWIGADDRWHVPSREAARPPTADRRRAGGRDLDAHPRRRRRAPRLRHAERRRVRSSWSRSRTARRFPSPSRWRSCLTTPRHEARCSEARPARHHRGGRRRGRASFCPRRRRASRAIAAVGMLDVVTSGAAEAPTTELVAVCDDAQAGGRVRVPASAHRGAAGGACRCGPGSSTVSSPRRAFAAADVVVRGWQVQIERGPRIDVPDDRFRRALDAGPRRSAAVPRR